VPDVFLKLAQKFWPGALTIVMEATHRVPLKVTGNTGRVALRWANSRIPSAVIEAVGGPITGTSANLTGMPACTNAQDLLTQLGDRLPLILDGGETGAKLASTIVRIEGEEWVILRDGVITEEQIEASLSA
jgi:L-threonylcarbamoyladenylate synthase